MNKRKSILIIGFIISLVLIIGMILLFKHDYVADFLEESSKTENYGGTIIINFDKDVSKSNYCIYLKDTEYNNAVNFSKTPIQVVVLSIGEEAKFEVVKKENWSREKYDEFLNKINNLEKYEESNTNYIKIRDYTSDCYVDMLNLNSITYEYFLINLNVPVEYMLK